MNRRRFLSQSAAASLAAPLLASAQPKEKKDAVTQEYPPAKEYIWSGAVTTTSARIVVKIAEPPAKKDKDDKIIPATPSVRIGLSEDDAKAPATLTEPATARPENDYTLHFDLADLKPLTLYHYSAWIDGKESASLHGRFRTFPKGAAGFRICFASCAQTGSRHKVFETIQKHNPAFFLHMGDIHPYENISRLDSAKRRAAYATVLGSPTQSSLYRSVPVAYVWDDHDYLGNNSGGHSPAGAEARLTYQQCIPHYPLGLGSGDVPIAQVFSCGRVRFILTDLRSARKRPATMMGEQQKKWFKAEVLAAKKEHGLIVWMSSMPWIATVDDPKNVDRWGGSPQERREIANFLKDNGVKNLCIVSGDAHMLAINDGTNSDYADGGGMPIPVFHAASLDKTGSIKGGPYSKGTFPGGGQFGLMTIEDDGKKIQVRWSGRNADDKEIVGHSFSVGG